MAGINTPGFAQQSMDKNNADLPISQPKSQGDGDLRTALGEASSQILGPGATGQFQGMDIDPRFGRQRYGLMFGQHGATPSAPGIMNAPQGAVNPAFQQGFDLQDQRSQVANPAFSTGQIPQPGVQSLAQGGVSTGPASPQTSPQNTLTGLGSREQRPLAGELREAGRTTLDYARGLPGAVRPFTDEFSKQFQDGGLPGMVERGALGIWDAVKKPVTDIGGGIVYGGASLFGLGDEFVDFVEKDRTPQPKSVGVGKPLPATGGIAGLETAADAKKLNIARHAAAARGDAAPVGETTTAEGGFKLPPTKAEAKATEKKAAAVKAEEIANLDPVEAKYRETYNANPQLQAKALKFAQDNGLAGKTDEESINNAIRQGITNKADREQYVRSGAAQRDRASINEQMKQQVFAAAKQGGNAGITADARYRSAMGNFDAAVQRYGSKVGQALTDPAGLKASDPQAFQALQSTFSLPDADAGVGAGPSSALAQLAEAPTGGGLRTGGSKFVQETASQLSQAVDFATAEMGGQLTPALQKELDGITSELGRRRGSNSGGNSDFTKKRVGPFIQKLQSAIATEKASVASQTAKSKAAKDMYSIALSEKKFSADQAYRGAKLRLETSKAIAASGKKVGALTPDQALKHMTNLAEEVDTEGIWEEFLKLNSDGASQEDIQKAMVGWAPNDATWLNLYLSTRKALN